MSNPSRSGSKRVRSEDHELSFKGISLRTPWLVKRLALTGLVMNAIFLVILLFALSFSIPVMLFAVLCGGPYLIWTARAYSLLQKLETPEKTREDGVNRYLKTTEIFCVVGLTTLLLWSCIFFWLGLHWAFALDVYTYYPVLGMYVLAFVLSFVFRRRILDLEVRGAPDTWWGKLWTFGSAGLYATAAAIGAGWGMILARTTVGKEIGLPLGGFLFIAAAFLLVPGVALNLARWQVLRSQSPEP